MACVMNISNIVLKGFYKLYISSLFYILFSDITSQIYFDVWIKIQMIALVTLAMLCLYHILRYQIFVYTIVKVCGSYSMCHFMWLMFSISVYVSCKQPFTKIQLQLYLMTLNCHLPYRYIIILSVLILCHVFTTLMSHLT